MPETPSASSTARRMELTVESRLTMEPLRSPSDSAPPSATNFTCSSASSAIRTQVLVLPMSRPTRYLSFFDNRRPRPQIYRFFATVTCSPQPLESGFKTTSRAYCKSTDCTQPALDCHCAKFSTSIRYLPVNSPEPKCNVIACVALAPG